MEVKQSATNNGGYRAQTRDTKAYEAIASGGLPVDATRRRVLECTNMVVCKECADEKKHNARPGADGRDDWEAIGLCV